MREIVKDQFKELVSVSHSQENQRHNSLREGSKIRLADFIRENTNPIVAEWEAFARTLTPAATSMTPLALRDHIHEILAFVIRDIDSPQSASEQVRKSHGVKGKESIPSAAETHAALRLAGGFNIDQMASEYRALRASVIKLWRKANTQMTDADITDLIRFNESIDQELAESVSHYTQKVSFSKDLFIGILSHDIRSPLNVISMSAQLILSIGTPTKERLKLNERQSMLANQIIDSTSRITEIVSDLLDVTHARFGSGLPVIRAPMDMGFVSRQLIDEMRAAYPTRTITLEISGGVKGDWDKARIGQAISNLIGNAIQYSFTDSAINVTVKGATEEVIISVHNEGVPILPENIGTLFDSFTRAITDEGNHPGAVNLGLGLYITKEIVVGHGGTIDVASTEEDGTTFTARFPRSVRLCKNID